MLQLCTMATAHYDNAVWVPMPIIHPKNWLLVVENSRLFAQRAPSARCAPYASTLAAHRVRERAACPS